jgi:hypothetical protein
MDLSGLKTVSLKDRGGKVKQADFASAFVPGSGIAGLLESLPHILAGDSFRAVVTAIATARARRKPILWGLGGHVIKCGMAPILLDLMQRGFATGFAMNGSASIHDFEIALCGSTSEDVEAVLPDGRFGSAEETGREWNAAIAGAQPLAVAAGDSQRLDAFGTPERSDLVSSASPEAGPSGLSPSGTSPHGVGAALGIALDRLSPAEHRTFSLLLQAWTAKVPVTVHVAFGTDTPHAHPACDPQALGAATHLDFRLFCTMVSELNDGGVYINAGSAVIMPEVFLKAVSTARNLGCELRDFTTVNLDFLQHYRPRVNVVERPHAQAGGHGYSLTGHHEIMIPLLAAALIDTPNGLTSR